jgi:hypothetical protein
LSAWSGPPPAQQPPPQPAIAVASMLANSTTETVPPTSGETYFDDLAFEAAEPEAAGSATDPSAWQVQKTTSPPPVPSEQVEEDLPVVVGRSSIDTPPPLWIVGEPAKK